MPELSSQERCDKHLKCDTILVSHSLSSLILKTLIIIGEDVIELLGDCCWRIDGKVGNNDR